MAHFNENKADLRNLTKKDFRETGNILYMLLSDNDMEALDADLLKINQGKTIKAPDWMDYRKYALDNINVSYKNNKVISNDMSEADKCELLGVLIDVVEDWLDSKGITTDDISNDEREPEDESAAIIYGSDYDYLADKFAEILGITR